MLVWFVTIAVLGVRSILAAPQVLWAANPWHGLQFFRDHGTGGFLTLGAVVLCVTGGEALYADMGHFGKRPIRIAWFAVVLPALLLNYFGQGALLLRASRRRRATRSTCWRRRPSSGRCSSSPRSPRSSPRRR